MVVPARNSNVYETEVADEIVVYDRMSDRAHRLNPTAAAVWRRCDGETSFADLAADVEQEIGQPVDDEVVSLALQELDEAGLLSGDLDEGLARRDALKRIGAVGAAAMVLPVVTSIVAPTPAMAQSNDVPGKPPGQPG